MGTALLMLYFLLMKKILIGLVIFVLLAVGARAFWAYKQMQKSNIGQVPSSITAPTQPQTTSDQPNVANSGQGQAPSQQAAKSLLPTVSPVKQPATAPSRPPYLLSYRINEGGGYDKYFVSGVNLLNIKGVLLGSSVLAHLVWTPIDSKTSSEIVFYMSESDIIDIKDKKYDWICGVYDAESIKCDTNRLTLTQ
jgi:hypothetical protein